MTLTPLVQSKAVFSLQHLNYKIAMSNLLGSLSFKFAKPGPNSKEENTRDIDAAFERHYASQR